MLLTIATLAAAGAISLTNALVTEPRATTPTGAVVPVPPARLTDKTLLYEVVRHLYRWYIDERDLDGVVAANEIVFRVRELTPPKLDEGDNSRFGEIVLPQFKLRVKVKAADYAIPELNVAVKNDAFRITSVTPIDDGATPAKDAVEIKVDYQELRDELFRTRNQADLPEGDLLERLRAAVRSQLLKEQPDLLKDNQTQVIYLAPLSPVANETWVFWETGRSLIRFASDIDLTNPAVWDHEELAVKLYSLDKKVVVSHDEVAGSNAFMTRDEAGRALFNCMVLGKRMELTPGKPAAPPKNDDKK